MASVASQTPFSELSQLCEKIYKTNKSDRKYTKRKILEDYFTYYRERLRNSPVKDESLFPILRLLIPTLDRARSSYGVQEVTLARLYVTILALPKEGIDAQKLLSFKVPKSGHSINNFADQAYQVLKYRCPKQGTLSVEEVNNHLDAVAAAFADKDMDKKQEHLKALITHLSAEGQKWLIRMILKKELRLGLGKDAILELFHPDAKELYDTRNDLRKVCMELRDPAVRLEEKNIMLFECFRPMLADKTVNLNNVEASMDRKPFYIETKFDGERFQLHKNGNSYKYFSRNGFDYTMKFGGSNAGGSLTPYIAPLFSPEVESCILDGEMLIWDQSKNFIISKGANLDVKSLNPGGNFQPYFVAFDILLYNKKVLSSLPLRERLKYLEKVAKPLEGRFSLAERKIASTKQEAIDALNMAIETREEGIILKQPDSIYKPNARKGGWAKIKPDYVDGMMDHLDLLIIGGYYGKGRRRDYVSQFLLGLAVPDPVTSKPSFFYSLTRVGSGYSDETLYRLMQHLAPHWKNVERKDACPSNIVWTKEKPDVWVEPDKSFLVEVKASEIVASDAYKTGYTLRFPRVEHVRYDKPLDQCMTFTEFATLRQMSEGKLANRLYVDNGAYHSERKRKIGGSPAKPNLMLAPQFQSVDVSNIAKISEFLKGKEFCIINGTKEMDRVALEKRVVAHGGTVVRNPGEGTFCVVADKKVVQLQSLIKSGKYDVIRASWLIRCLNARKLVPYSPMEVWQVTEKTKAEMSRSFDPYGDHYTNPATKESLQFALQRVQELVNPKLLKREEIADIEYENFTGPYKYSLFRLCKVYVGKEALNGTWHSTCPDVARAALESKIYGAEITNELASDVTHVVWDGISSLEALKEKNWMRTKKFHLVTDKWVQDCIDHGRILEEREYYPSSL